MRRLRTSARLREFVVRCVRMHLPLGFMVHRTPLSLRQIDRYLRSTAPWEVEIIVLSVADRLATRGPRTSESAVRRHLALAREVMDAHFALVNRGPVRPLLAGDEAAAELGRPPGPWLARAPRPAARGAGGRARCARATRRAGSPAAGPHPTPEGGRPRARDGRRSAAAAVVRKAQACLVTGHCQPTRVPGGPARTARCPSTPGRTRACVRSPYAPWSSPPWRRSRPSLLPGGAAAAPGCPARRRRPTRRR